MRTIRLLVVEDSPGYLYLIRSAFQGHRGDFSWEIDVAINGEEALQVLFDEENNGRALPDIILLDWNLPRISGNEVLRRIKEHKNLRRIPVLVFSTSDAEQDIHDAYDGHANGYITKPASGKMMEAIVEAIAQFWAVIAQLPKVMR